MKKPSAAQMRRDDQEARYAEIMGGEALTRQKRLNEERRPCCGMPRSLDHASSCRYANLARRRAS